MVVDMDNVRLICGQPGSGHLNEKALKTHNRPGLFT